MRVLVNGISKRFGSVSALRGVRLEVEHGEFFFLLGPSGCGKTTLLRILAGFEEPDEGTLHFDEEDVTRLAPERRGAAMVFQSYALWPHLTVEENIAFGLEVQGTAQNEKRRRVGEMLDLVRMGGYEKRRPGQLSGGQQQRVALARALVVQPRLVLLDEPLSNLDARLRLQMRTEIRQIIKDSGHTAVYVTHDQKEALSMADRCAILDQGVLVQVGRPREVYERPTNRFVADFLGEINFLSGRIASSQGNGMYTVQMDQINRLWSGIAQEELGIGAQVLCGIRPECWKVDDHASPGSNTLNGSVVSSVYLGEVTQHCVACSAADGGDIRVLEIHSPVRRPGPVTLVAEPESTIVLKSE
ncbi:MAG TPA: ABC transporter ATP-binding protein [bacterium]|nr:ABC transporter ATP-binding protein [bacterium]